MATKLGANYDVSAWMAIHLPVLATKGAGKNSYQPAPPPKDLADLKYLRVTATQTLERCPRAWAARHLDHDLEPGADNFHSWLGTAVHEICEAYLKGLWSVGSPHDHAIFTMLNQAGVSPTEQVSAMRYVVERLPQRHQVLALEHEFTLPLLGEDAPWLRGHVDLIYESDLVTEDDTVVIRDHKTNRKARSIKDWEDDLQTLAYGLAVGQLWPDRPRRFEIGYVNLGKVLTWPINERHDATARQRLADAWGNLQAQWSIHGPDNWSAWMAFAGDHCSFCPHQAKCDVKETSSDLIASLGDLW